MANFETATLAASARNGDLAGCAAQELRAGQFFHEVGIDGPGLQELDAVLKAAAVVFQTCELFLRHGEARLRVRQDEKTATSPNRVITEIRNSRRTHCRDHKCFKKTRYAVSDSHWRTESQTDSARQAKTLMNRAFPSSSGDLTL
jgi:hypothetical protein